jgi:hypothetical protein
VALGDLGKLVNVDVQGEILNLKMTMNSGSVVAQLSMLACAWPWKLGPRVYGAGRRLYRRHYCTWQQTG